MLRILVGNKIDREDREIPTPVGEDFAARHNMYFLETSAKEAENVERLFMQIAEDLMKVNIFCTIVNSVFICIKISVLLNSCIKLIFNFIPNITVLAKNFVTKNMDEQIIMDFTN